MTWNRSPASQPLCISLLAGEDPEPSPPMPLWLFALCCVVAPFAFGGVIYGLLFIAFVLEGR